MIVLGIDAGGSSTRWLLCDGSRELGRGSVPSRSGPPYGDEARRENVARIEAVAAAALELGRPRAVVAGVTGLDEGGEPAAELAAALRRSLDLPEGRVRVVNDMQIAYRSVFEPERGVLVYAGTGSIACCELADGTLLRVGGHGYLIDDAGGGFWIGSAALRAVLRATDEGAAATGGSGGRAAEAPASLEEPGAAPAPDLLAQELWRRLGGREWGRVRAEIYGGGRSAVAALVPAVGAAAAGGDPVAARILAEAGRELARLATVVSRRLGRDLPVAFTGGIARLGSPVTDAFAAALPAGSELRVVDVEPVETAARLALELSSPQKPPRSSTKPSASSS